MSVATKHRKQRTVKNGYIDIDSVADLPGKNYCDWINITKDKLKKRESQLLSIKLVEIQRIVNNEISSSSSHHFNKYRTYKIHDIKIKYIFNHSLFIVIDQWEGVQLDRVKTKIDKYRDYFVIAKNWWDLRKKKLIGSSFWLPIFRDIQQVKN